MSSLRDKRRRLDCPPCTNGGKRPRRRAVVSARERSLVRISSASSIDTCPRIRPTSRSSTRRPPQTDQRDRWFFPSFSHEPTFSHLSQPILPIHHRNLSFDERGPWRRSGRCASGSMRNGGPCRRRRRVTTRAMHEHMQSRAWEQCKGGIRRLMKARRSHVD